MSKFLEDTKTIDEKIQMDIPQVPETQLKAVFLPYYVDPLSMQLTVILKRSILPGAYSRTGRKMGLSCLDVILPTDEPMTIEEAFETLHTGAKLQDSIPFGSVMLHPETSSEAVEMVLAHIDPPEMIDEDRGIIYQEAGKFEIGIVAFDEILGAIQENFIQDMTVRLMLSELYIMAMEEANKQNGDVSGDMNAGGEGMIGGANENYPKAAQDTVQNETEKTSTIPDDVIAENSQMDFGAIYSKK